jgi:hypothetical protein
MPLELPPLWCTALQLDIESTPARLGLTRFRPRACRQSDACSHCAVQRAARGSTSLCVLGTPSLATALVSGGIGFLTGPRRIFLRIGEHYRLIGAGASHTQSNSLQLAATEAPQTHKQKLPQAWPASRRPRTHPTRKHVRKRWLRRSSWRLAAACTTTCPRASWTRSFAAASPTNWQDVDP